MQTQDGGYDDGYRLCPCFWGRETGSLVRRFLLDRPVEGLNILDAGCGEGKNSVALAKLGAKVVAVDCSAAALENARNSFNCNDVEWRLGDIRTINFDEKKFDLVIAYGLMHCLRSKGEIETTIRNLQDLTVLGGWNMVCAFNDRQQDLTAHPGFKPCLIPHADYLGMYTGWNLEMFSDEDLRESHPHNNIPHTHSMTRLIARKALK